MIHSLASLSPVTVIVVSLLGIGFGFAWYSPFLFARARMRELNITPESIRAGSGRAPVMMGGAFLLTMVSTFTLAALIASHHSSGALNGAEFGLLVGAGLVAAREGTSALFENRTFRLFLIVSGHDVALCVFQGAVLGAWH